MTEQDKSPLIPTERELFGGLHIYRRSGEGIVFGNFARVVFVFGRDLVDLGVDYQQLEQGEECGGVVHQVIEPSQVYRLAGTSCQLRVDQINPSRSRVLIEAPRTIRVLRTELLNLPRIHSRA